MTTFAGALVARGAGLAQGLVRPPTSPLFVPVEEDAPAPPGRSVRRRTPEHPRATTPVRGSEPPRETRPSRAARPTSDEVAEPRAREDVRTARPASLEVRGPRATEPAAAEMAAAAEPPERVVEIVRREIAERDARKAVPREVVTPPEPRLVVAAPTPAARTEAAVASPAPIAPVLQGTSRDDEAPPAQEQPRMMPHHVEATPRVEPAPERRSQSQADTPEQSNATRAEATRLQEAPEERGIEVVIDTIEVHVDQPAEQPAGEAAFSGCPAGFDDYRALRSYQPGWPS